MALCQYAWSTKTVPKALMTWGIASLGSDWHPGKGETAGYAVCHCMHATKHMPPNMDELA